ncbi:MAG: tetraacyldisaccharide 4'-kinase [Flavobacteriales bacterium]|nr:tetraacyldisaccharide 4'-kinase [Flavobacteriales bacterium]
MPFLRLFLLPIALFYGLVVFFRNMLFDYGIFSSKEYSVPIISVGNLCAGGSGKSPLVEYILRLIDNREKVAVLSRGYGRDSTGFQWVTSKSFVKDVGDESLQIARKFPELNVAVSESRNKGIQEIIHNECDLILLDDAYQHRWVKPGLNILLTTYDNLFINDNLLPYGKLRESKKNFRRADIIVVTKTPYPLLPLDEYRLKEQISPFFNQKLCYSYLEYQEPVSLYTKKTLSIEGKEVILMTAIASADLLKEYVDSRAKIIEHFEFKDHYNFKKKDIKKIIECYNKIDSQEKLILTTEKDATRLALYENNFKGIHIGYIPIEFKFQGKTNFNELILNYVEQNRVDSNVSRAENAIHA